MKDWSLLAQALQMGWVVVISLLIPLFAGIWLDKRLGTTPLFILLGMAVGILAATLGVVRVALRTFADLDKSQKQLDETAQEEDEDL
jgi:F0F1-type ATP synthase assembly protein I